jgi:hypothetical protein
VSSLLFSGVSFTIDAPHSLETVASIPGAKALHPVYAVSSLHGDETIFSDNQTSDEVRHVAIAHQLTGVDQVHSKLNNYGRGIRVRKFARPSDSSSSRV